MSKNWLAICMARLEGIEKRLEQNPKDLKALLEQAILYYEPLCESDKAVEMFESIIKQDPMYVDAYMWLGELLADHMADELGAEKVLQTCLALDPTRADCHVILGWAALPALGKEKESEYHYREAIKYQPTWVRPRLCLVNYLLTKHEYQKAKQEAHEALHYILDKIPEEVDSITHHYERLITGRYDPTVKNELLNALKEAEQKINEENVDSL